MRIYLDNCCFNRPFDNQSSIRVKLETDAKLFVQLKIKEGKIDLVWSYMLDFENDANPFPERKNTIEKWRRLSGIDVVENSNILSKAVDLTKNGLKPKDALHIACAIEAGCEYFLTTDDQVLKKMNNNSDIAVLNPTDFIKIIENL
jgi:predicted nucleic acid-binding protein